MVSVEERIAVRRGGSEVFRRAHDIGNGDRLPDLEKEVGFFTVRLKMSVSRPFLNQRLGLEDTPSRGNLSKETLNFLEINPPSIA
jgi:hypothetical protein